MTATMTETGGDSPHIFEGYGVELEYMIVDRDSLDVLPKADKLLEAVAGRIVNEVETGPLGWSNELALHVVELKTLGPVDAISPLAPLFRRDIRRVNELLRSFGGMLMPTAMHPWMDPHRHTVLWPHGNHEIYESYHRIFDCRGHGWSNLQSAHLNLGFNNDQEFGRLHAAVRLVLPLLPALAASSPVVEGKTNGLLDNRLEFYRHNQKRLPAIAGAIIPEAVSSRAEYEERIFKKIYAEVAPHDRDNILRYEWLNSRGAIARFERNAIEIRLLDVQETAEADLAVAAGIVGALKALASGCWSSTREQLSFNEQDLLPLLLGTIGEGERFVIDHGFYLEALGLPGRPLPVADVWRHLTAGFLADCRQQTPELVLTLEKILEHGPLARRILTALGNGYSVEDLKTVYRRLCLCLQEGELFLP